MSIVKVIRITIVIFVVAIIGIFVVFIINLNYVDNGITNSEFQTTNVINIDNDIAYIIQIVAEKNSDWTKLPLSNKFKTKFNSEYGILGKDDNYSRLYGSTNLLDKEKKIAGLVVFHDAKEEEYYIHYIVNDKNELDDVEIVDKILRYDENGKEVIYKETMNGAFVSNIIQLAAPYRLDWDPFDYVYVTDHYLHKWGGGFVDYDDTGCAIEDIDALNDKDKQIVYLSVALHKFDKNGEIIGYEPEKYYKVHYIIDDKAWLDDVEVEEISKEEIDRLLNEISSKEEQHRES